MDEEIQFIQKYRFNLTFISYNYMEGLTLHYVQMKLGNKTLKYLCANLVYYENV